MNSGILLKLKNLITTHNRLFIMLVIGIISLVGTTFRFYHFIRTSLIPNDALDFIHAAQWILGRESIDHFATVPREPGWTIVLSICLIPFTVDYASLFEIARLTSILFSVLQIPLTYFVAKEIANQFDTAKGKQTTIGLLSATFVSLNPIMIEASGMGLREPLQGTLFLIWILVYYSKGIGRDFLIIGGFCSFYSVLVRLDTILLFTFLSLVVLYQEWNSGKLQENRLVNILLSLSPALIAIASYLLWASISFFLFGNPSATSDIFLDGYFRTEFPGVPLPEDLTLFTYLFQYHSLSDLVIAFVRGFSNLTKMYLQYLDIFLGSLLLLAFGYFSYKGKFVLPAFFLYSVSFYSLFAHFWGYTGFWRLLTPYIGISLIMITTILVKDLPDFEIKLGQRCIVVPSAIILAMLSLIILSFWISGFFLIG